MTQLPSRLPILSAGKQEPGSGMVCAEQAVNWLVSGRPDLRHETDRPSCVQPVLNALSIKVNDLLPDDRRGEMWPLILAQPGTARPDMEPGLSANLATWCARTAECCAHTSSAARACVGVGHGAAALAARASTAAYTANAYTASAAALAALADAARAAAYAATAAGNVSARADALLALLAGCQAEHARLTGHQPTPVETARVERLATLVGSGDATNQKRT